MMKWAGSFTFLEQSKPGYQPLGWSNGSLHKASKMNSTKIEATSSNDVLLGKGSGGYHLPTAVGNTGGYLTIKPTSGERVSSRKL